LAENVPRKCPHLKCPSVITLFGVNGGVIYEARWGALAGGPPNAELCINEFQAPFIKS
jgi:hypothetical protein